METSSDAMPDTATDPGSQVNSPGSFGDDGEPNDSTGQVPGDVGQPDFGSDEKTPPWLRDVDPNKPLTPNQQRKIINDSRALYGQYRKMRGDSQEANDDIRGRAESWDSLLGVPGIREVLGALANHPGADGSRGLQMLQAELSKMGNHQTDGRQANPQSHRKPLLEVPEDQFEQEFESRVQALIDRQVEQRLGRYFDPLNREVMGMKTENDMQQLLKAGHTDLPKYCDATLRIMQELPGLGMRDALLIAKGRADESFGKPRPTKQDTFTEMGGQRRPTGSPAWADRFKQNVLASGPVGGLRAGG